MYARALEHIGKIDSAILIVVRRLENNAMTSLMKAFTRLGDTAAWGFLSFVLLSLTSVNRNLWWVVTASATIAALLAQAIKHLIKRPRPEQPPGLQRHIEPNDQFAFPSGHTCTAFAVAFSVIALAPGLGALLVVHGFCVGLSRIYLGVHYPFDVLVGGILGTLVGLCIRSALMLYL